MEDLNRQQIILLTLFVTFVTSIATGIVTVSLMDQAPVGVTGTVERVIYHTVAAAAGDSSNSTASASDAAASLSTSPTNTAPVDAIASATAIAEKSIVRIKRVSTSGAAITTGLGIVASKNGLIITDKSSIAVFGDYVAVFSDGNSIPVDILESQNDGDIVFLAAEAASTHEKFIPVSFVPLSAPNAPVLGQSVISVSGLDTFTVDEGIIHKIITDASSTVSAYVTTIDSPDAIVGSALFDLSGDCIGIKTFSLNPSLQVYATSSASSRMHDAYYPAALLQSVIAGK